MLVGTLLYLGYGSVIAGAIFVAERLLRLKRTAGNKLLCAIGTVVAWPLVAPITIIIEAWALTNPKDLE